MDSFPVELWMSVFQRLRKRDWLALCRTCSTFHKIAQEQLYRDVHLHSGVKRANTDRLFARSLEECPSLASLVRTLTFRNRSTRSVAFQDTRVFRRLSSFSNLRALELHSVDILDADVWVAAIHSLSELRAVTYIRCQIFMGTRETHHDTRIITVSIKYVCTSVGWSDLIPPSLRSLEIHGKTIFSKHALETMLSELTVRHSPHQLTTLTITGPTPGNIVKFLLSCPQIRKLSLPCTWDKDIILSLCTLPHHALPFLEDISGFSDYIEAFIVGHRIHSAHIKWKSWEDYSTNALRSLHRSLVPVTRLKIVNCMAIDALQDAPITLQELHVVGKTVADMFVWLRSLSRMPDLYTFRVSGEYIPPDHQAALVDTASATCKSLREFVFYEAQPHAAETIHTWCWRKGGPWEYYSFVDDNDAYSTRR